jgi:hypothetical protein
MLLLDGFGTDAAASVHPREGERRRGSIARQLMPASRACERARVERGDDAFRERGESMGAYSLIFGGSTTR